MYFGHGIWDWETIQTLLLWVLIGCLWLCSILAYCSEIVSSYNEHESKLISRITFAHLASIIAIPQNIVKHVNAVIFECVCLAKIYKTERDILTQDYDKRWFKGLFRVGCLMI